MRRARHTTVAAALAAAFLLAGCGVAGGGPATQPDAPASTAPGTTGTPGNGIAEKPVNDIIKTSGAALRSARSVRIRASYRQGGQQVRMDLRLTSQRNQMAGWIEERGTRLEVIVTGGKVYVRGREFLQQQGGADVAALVGDRWISLPLSASKDLGPLSNLTIPSFADTVFGDWSLTLLQRALVRKSTVNFRGQPAVRLQAPDGSFYVAAVGKPYPLLLEGKDGQDTGRFEFSEYDRNPSIRAPRDVLDTGSLGG